MSLEEFYNHIVKRIEKEIRICDVDKWDGEVLFIADAPLEYTERDYYDYAVVLLMKYTEKKHSGEITRYVWKKHIIAIFLMLDSFLFLNHNL